MSNQIFCIIDSQLCSIVKEIARDRPVIDCGAGRGMFGSLYDEKVISIDIDDPKEPLSKINIFKSEQYCFPIDSVPIFIRPCHSFFPHITLSLNINKIDTAIYVGLEKNLEYDLHLSSKEYSVERYESDWIGQEGERIWVITINKDARIKGLKTLYGKILHVSDPMLSFSIASQMQEFNECVETPLLNRGILVDGKRLSLHEFYPFNEAFDYMFFDWGGMSMGNSMMEHYCRNIAEEAKDYPSRTWVIVSTFTEYAMKEAIEEFGNDNHNIFTSIEQFSDYINKNKLL